MNYNEMMRLVVGRAGLTRRQADRVVTGTLTVLAETLSAKETKDLLAQLPKSLRDRVPVTAEITPMRPIEFVARVAELSEATSIDAAETEVRAVFTTLDEAVNAGEMQDVLGELGPAYADLFDRPVRAAASASTGDDGEPGPTLVALAGAVVTSVAGLATRVVGIAVRPVAAGLRLASPRSH